MAVWGPLGCCYLTCLETQSRQILAQCLSPGWEECEHDGTEWALADTAYQSIDERGAGLNGLMGLLLAVGGIPMQTSLIR